MKRVHQRDPIHSVGGEEPAVRHWGLEVCLVAGASAEPE